MSEPEDPPFEEPPVAEESPATEAPPTAPPVEPPLPTEAPPIVQVDLDQVGGDSSAAALHDALATIDLRVWAELGRAKFALGEALNLPVGAVVDLDRAAADPIDLFVNGVRVGRGELMVTDDGDWAMRVHELLSAQDGEDSMLVAAVTQTLGKAAFTS